MDRKLTPLQREAESAKAGAKAGAKARKRERSESDAQIAAVLAAESGDRDGAKFQTTYRIGDERRSATNRETARATLTPAELLAACGSAAKRGAGIAAGRHGVPPLSPAEIADVRDELVCRILEDVNRETGRTERAEHGATLPRREKFTPSYLATRAAGLILNDPARRHEDANLTAETAGELAAAAESQARSRDAGRDPMLRETTADTGTETEPEPGGMIDGTPADLAAAADLANLPAKARRAAAYIVGGGRSAGWARAWRVTPGAARTRHIPEGSAILRDGRGWDLAAAWRVARLDDTAAWIEETGADPRALIERAWIGRVVSLPGIGKTDAARKLRRVTHGPNRPATPAERAHAARVAKVNGPRVSTARSVKLAEPITPRGRFTDGIDHPVKVRTDRRIIRTAARTERESRAKGWTKARA